MRYSLQRGLIGQETRKTDGKTFVLAGEVYDRCPFCMTSVPLQAKVCTGCGAVRYSGPLEWVEDSWGKIILAVVILLIIWFIIVPYL